MWRIKGLTKKIQSYHENHRKPPKNYTFMGWIHAGIQILASAFAMDTCASQAVVIEQTAKNALSVPMYWYWGFGFAAALVISTFGLWDFYIFGKNQLQILHGGP